MRQILFLKPGKAFIFFSFDAIWLNEYSYQVLKRSVSSIIIEKCVLFENENVINVPGITRLKWKIE